MNDTYRYSYISNAISRLVLFLIRMLIWIISGKKLRIGSLFTIPTNVKTSLQNKGLYFNEFCHPLKKSWGEHWVVHNNVQISIQFFFLSICIHVHRLLISTSRFKQIDILRIKINDKHFCLLFFYLAKKCKDNFYTLSLQYCTIPYWMNLDCWAFVSHFNWTKYHFSQQWSIRACARSRSPRFCILLSEKKSCKRIRMKLRRWRRSNVHKRQQMWVEHTA